MRKFDGCSRYIDNLYENIYIDKYLGIHTSLHEKIWCNFANYTFFQVYIDKYLDIDSLIFDKNMVGALTTLIRI